MTRREMAELFAVMLLAWPNAETFRGGIGKLGPTIELWTTCLPDVDFWTGQQAVVKLCRECKFPPGIAEFREKAAAVKNELRARIEQGWGYLSAPLKLRSASVVEAYNAAPREIRAVVDAMGGPERLLLADGPCRVLNYDGFRAAYEQLLRGRSALTVRPRAAIGAGGS